MPTHEQAIAHVGRFDKRAMSVLKSAIAHLVVTVLKGVRSLLMVNERTIFFVQVRSLIL